MSPSPPGSGWSASAIALEVASLALVPLALLASSPPAGADAYADAVLSFTYIGLAPMALFYLLAAGYGVADACASRSCAARYKFQGPAGVVMDASAYPRAALVSLKSWLLVGLPAAWLVARVLAPARGCPSPRAPWSLWEFAAHLPVFVVVVDAVFFASHRALHSRALYARVHALHHSFPAPFALAAVYAHPLEHLLSNVACITAGPLLCGSHPATAAAWACLATFSTAASHSGWALPWSDDRHDWHHTVPSEHFGTALMLIDRALGTNARYRAEGGGRRKAARE